MSSIRNSETGHERVESQVFSLTSRAHSSRRKKILQEIDLLDPGKGNNESNTQLPSTSTSPNESVIQQRGLRKKAATYKFLLPHQYFFRSPSKSPRKRPSSPRSVVHKPPTRSSPRKHFVKNLNFGKKKPGEQLLSPPTIPRKGTLHFIEEEHEAQLLLQKKLKCLNHRQLLTVLDSVVQNFPETREIVEKFLPEPDFSPAFRRLTLLHEEACKAIINNSLSATIDSSYIAETHLKLFKRECDMYCEQYLESEQWPVVFDFLLMAFKLSLEIPIIFDECVNNIKSTCLCHIAALFSSGVLKANLEKDKLKELIHRLKSLPEDDMVKNCICIIDHIINSKP